MVMQEPVRERIGKLRVEIAQIREANRLYLQSGGKLPETADHERRRERLQQIVDELATLIDWNKP